jgi:hypothetical protein
MSRPGAINVTALGTPTPGGLSYLVPDYVAGGMLWLTRNRLCGS